MAYVALLSSLLVACAELTGRTVADAGDGGDVPSTDAADGGDVPVADASTCTVAPRFDGRVARTIVGTGAETTLGGPQPNGTLSDSAGTLYAFGACANCIETNRTDAALWHFTAEGVLDTSWGDGGRATINLADRAAYWVDGAIDTRGRVLVAGARRVGSVARPAVARYLPSGRLDAVDFATGGNYFPSSGAVGGMEGTAYAVRVDARGIVVAGGQGPTGRNMPPRALVFRLTDNGALDAAFGTNGVVTASTVGGCFDMAFDGDDLVLACTSSDQRPALLRLDTRGRRGAWGDNGVVVHTMAPRDFEPRALRRDSRGRWLVVGSVTRFGAVDPETPAVVRFLPDGTPDTTWGDGGVSLLTGVRRSVLFVFSRTAVVTCDDGLLVSAKVGARGVIAVLDARGQLARNVGEGGYLAVPERAETTDANVQALVPRARDVIVHTAYDPLAFTYYSLAL